MPFWKAGLATTVEQPEPVPSVKLVVFQTFSLQPRALLAVVSEVPPTAVTYFDVAGYSPPS